MAALVETKVSPTVHEDKKAATPSNGSDEEVGVADGIDEGALLRKLDLRLLVRLPSYGHLSESPKLGSLH